MEPTCIILQLAHKADCCRKKGGNGSRRREVYDRGEAEGGRRDWKSGEESDSRESSRMDQETEMLKGQRR